MSDPIQFHDLFTLLNEHEDLMFEKISGEHFSDYRIKLTHIDDGLSIKSSMVELTTEKAQAIKTHKDLRELINHLRKLLYK